MESEAGKTRLLSQYVSSLDFMHRFVDSLPLEKEILRAEYQPGPKEIDKSEFNLDALDYFKTNKEEMEESFFNELCDEIGTYKAKLFCETITQYWYDGRAKRNSKIVKELKKSISNYLTVETGKDNLSSIVVKHKFECCSPSYDTNDIEKILKLNNEFLYKYLSEWIDNHPNMREIGRGDIFFRRGIKAEKVFDTNEPYKEWDFINSYSLAYTIPEKFCKIRDKNKNISIMLNADCDYFNDRVLFFAPFIKGMDIAQFEIGVIPNKDHDYLFYQGEHSGIHEYLIGDHAEISLTSASKTDLLKSGLFQS